MKNIIFILKISAICFAIIALLLVWIESELTISLFNCKMLESVFVICSLMLVKEYKELECKH